MKTLPIIAGILCTAALSPLAATAESLSVVRIFPMTGGYHDVDDSEAGLSSFATDGIPSNGGAAQTSPGKVGMRAAFPAGTHGGLVTTKINDRWHPTFTGTGAPPATVPMTLSMHFDGTLDPLFVDPTLPTQPISMDVRFSLRGPFGGSEGSEFKFWAQYRDEGTVRFVRTTFGPDPSDVSGDIVYSGNHVSFNHDFNFDVPYREFDEIYNGSIALQGGENGLPVSASCDFFTTFAATLSSNNPNVTFTSDGGRTTVPEPSALMLLTAALATLPRRRRR